MSKKRAEKKIQIAIDKLIDLQQDLCDDPYGKIERVLEKLRHLEHSIDNGTMKDGLLHIK